MRAALLLPVVLGVVGTAVVLAYDRHWDGRGNWRVMGDARLGQHRPGGPTSSDHAGNGLS